MRSEFKTYIFVSTISYTFLVQTYTFVSTNAHAFLVQNLYISVNYFRCVFDTYTRSL